MHFMQSTRDFSFAIRSVHNAYKAVIPQPGFAQRLQPRGQAAVEHIHFGGDPAVRADVGQRLPSDIDRAARDQSLGQRAVDMAYPLRLQFCGGQGGRRNRNGYSQSSS